MSRPTRPPGPPYPDEPYPDQPYPDDAYRQGPYPDEPLTGEQDRVDPYADDRQPPGPPPAAPTQPRFTPRPGPPPPGPPQPGPAVPPPVPPPPSQYGGGAGPSFSPTAAPPHAPVPPPPASRPAQPPPPPDGGAAGPVFTPKSGGGRHGEKPRPSFTPRGGYAPPDDRRNIASPPTAFFSPAPAGYQPVPVPEEYGYAAARPAPRFTPVDREAPPDEGNRTRILQRPAEGPRSTGPQRADNTSPNLARSSRAMALGTIASRGTGFLRTLVLVTALGTGAFSQVYNNANTLPNTVYYLMLGGIFTAVVVPLLVRSAKEDPDRGEAYAERIFTLGVISLLFVTVIGTALAEPLVDLYAGNLVAPKGWSQAAEHHTMVLFAYFFIPQIFFYGMDSLLGAILNTRGRFGANMWTPVINNVVVIIVTGLFLMEELHRPPQDISSGAIHLLAIGTTLGIVIQSIALFPVMRRAGFSMRLRWDLRRYEIREIGRMAGWMFGYVVSQWLGNLVAQRVANYGTSGGYSAYAYAWQLFQLPYAIVGISVISALLPRMSGHANDRRYSLVRDDFSTGVRIASVIVVPAAIFLAVLGAPLCEFLFTIGRDSAPDARYIGEVFGAFSLGLVPFMLTQLQLRVFYSFHENRTPAIIGMVMLIVGVIGAMVVKAVLPSSQIVIGLGFAYDLVTLTGAVIAWPLLLRRVGSLDGWQITRSLVRMVLATVPGLIFILVVTAVIGEFMHQGRFYGFVVTVVAGGGALLLYAFCCRLLGIEEFRTLMRSVAGRFG